MSKYVDLTDVDKIILESYRSVLDGLSEYLGSGFELVLHSLEDLDHSAIKVINGHYTSRKEGAPITDLALKMLGRIKETGNNKENMVYFNRSKKGTPIRAATLPITGEDDKIIGLLCINFYMDIPLNIFYEDFFKTDTNTLEETFEDNTDGLIITALEEAKKQVYDSVHIPAANKNKEIITILYKRDIFNFKDAVIKVADSLGISKNTVYMHIRNINDEK